MHAPRGAVLSQHDDWMHRGDDPIVRDMSAYVYSIWVYRVELRPSKSDDEPLSNHVDIPFDPSYTVARNWTQRLCMEPRIPKVDGFQFVSVDTNPETHYLSRFCSALSTFHRLTIDLLQRTSAI